MSFRRLTSFFSYPAGVSRTGKLEAFRVQYGKTVKLLMTGKAATLPPLEHMAQQCGVPVCPPRGDLCGPSQLESPWEVAGLGGCARYSIAQWREICV